MFPFHPDARMAYHTVYNMRPWSPSSFIGGITLDGGPLLMRTDFLQPEFKAAVDLTVTLLFRCMHP